MAQNTTFNLIFLGLGWPWVREFDGFVIIFTGIRFPTQPNLVYQGIWQTSYSHWKETWSMENRPRGVWHIPSHTAPGISFVPGTAQYVGRAFNTVAGTPSYCTSTQHKMIRDLRPMTMEARCCQVFLSKLFKKKKKSQDTLVPPLYMDIHTRTRIFCKFCTTLIPVPGTSVRSVRPCHNTRGIGTAFLYLPRTSASSVRPCHNTRNFWKFRKIFIPVPGTSVSSVRPVPH